MRDFKCFTQQNSRTFYNDLTPYYHLIFNDWKDSIKRQAAILDSVIKSNWGDNIDSILDVACGIGTQAIGLSKLGYTLEASDISEIAIERAKEETKKEGLEINYSVANMLNVASHHANVFDLIICCDNSLPHLLTVENIKIAFYEFYKSVKAGGGCLVSVRDYMKERQESFQIKPYKVHVINSVKYILFQYWQFTDDIYDLSLYLVIDKGNDELKIRVFRTKYYAISVPKLVDLMEEVGFKNVKTIYGEYYQPIIIGSK